MKGYTSYSYSMNVVLKNAGWSDVNETVTIADANGNFDVFIPLKMLFKFSEDYQKIVINGKHELVLTRSSTDLNAVIQIATDNGQYEDFKIDLKKVRWLMQYVQLSIQGSIISPAREE